MKRAERSKEAERLWEEGYRLEELGRYDEAVIAYTASARLGETGKAVRERAAVVALNPVDRPQALYHLAVAQRDAGDVTAARRTVLRALEDAPHFERAQELLLSLRRTP